MYFDGSGAIANNGSFGSLQRGVCPPRRFSGIGHLSCVGFMCCGPLSFSFPPLFGHLREHCYDARSWGSIGVSVLQTRYLVGP